MIWVYWSLDLCYDNFVVSDPNANAWYASSECSEFVIPFGPSEVTQDLTINAYQFNMVSMNVVPEDLAIDNVLSDISVLLAQNDDGDFYAPGFGVNSIGDLNTSEGYKIFINGADDQMVSVTGTPADVSGALLLEAYKVNLLPYLPQDGMPSSDAFGSYNNDILLSANSKFILMYLYKISYK